MILEYFQMLDHVESIDFNKQSIKISSAIPQESPIFEGHFPDLPLVPGVLLIECMAQTSGLLYMALNEFKVMPFLMSVDNAKMRNFVKPSQVIDIQSRIEYEGSGFFVAKASVTSEGNRVCNGQLKLVTRPFNELPTLDHIMTMVDKIGLHDAVNRYQKRKIVQDKIAQESTKTK